MASEVAEQVDLESGERWLGAWSAEPARADDSSGRVGWLILTSRRVAFFQKRGLLGAGRLERPPLFSWRLELVRSLQPRRYEMKIGYGDRLAIPGISVDDQGFRLSREASSARVLEELLQARRARRSELNLPLD